METFLHDEENYLAWHEEHPDGFVFNHFGGTDPANNVLHKSQCNYLWRDRDEGSRTQVEKWCSTSAEELENHANATLGNLMWNRCGVCFPSEE